MNERIIQLAVQAGLIAPYASDREGLANFDYRKFAELIVLECSSICYKSFENGDEIAGLLMRFADFDHEDRDFNYEAALFGMD